ncbi:hypothetical protein N431DRAFT_445443 [Stipitochalara longipes BDJ]|nr:hypothetical protein N431DRAFT_445443 [Stipitochalara longipes BDJ]
MKKPDKPLRMPLPELCREFPVSSEEQAKREKYLSEHMNAACIQTQITQSIRDFSGSTTSQKLWLFLGNTLKREMVRKKIVAFGAGSLGYARDKTWDFANGSILAAQTQHAALVSIQKKLEIIYSHKIPIYLQDSEYTEEDKKIADKLGIKILNGNFGFGETWLEIDEWTLAFDFRCVTSFPPLYQIIFEITRPLAIISIDKWVEPDPA